jgi:hypothetical protein
MTPVVYSIREESSFIDDLSSKIKNDKDKEEAKILLSYPVVYIHFWPGKAIEYTNKKGISVSRQRFNVYVGESNDIVARTKEHYLSGADPSNWQSNLVKNRSLSQLIVIGHPHFNKSFTLDLENRLIDYIAPGNNIDNLFNARGNPQNGYYPVEEFDGVFHSVWRKLRKLNNDLFLPLSEIEKSAFFKASPLKKLTQDQLDAKEEILAKVYDALESGKEGQLIFVQGEAGTGKTVLNSALFYELITRGEEYFGREISCHLMVNHDQQLHVYQQIAKRLNLGDHSVHKPTSFINKFSENNKVDVAFIDEGHLLLTQGKQSYTGHNQLDDIMKRSRVTVIMFDEYQVLTAEEYWEPAVLDYFKELSYRQRNLLGLSQQLRMQCSVSTMKWINSFVEFRLLCPFTKDSQYDVRSFDSPKALHEAIKKKAETDSLSRIVATYDWPYNKKESPSNGGYWSVSIGNWSLPWNYETEKELTSKEQRANKSKAWAEQEHTIDEVGSTFTIQGFDLSYVGVILGPSVKYRNGEIIFDPSESHNNKATQRRTLKDGSKVSFGETFIRNEVKVLLTRGVNGLYIYACDKALREALKSIARL